jgi:hypothetical protein
LVGFSVEATIVVVNLKALELLF